MKVVEIEDLEVGDEILISCQSHFKYLKILRLPKQLPGVGWRGQTRYSSAKCSTRRTEKDVIWTNYYGKQMIRKEKVWEFGPEDHNINTYVNLMDRQILLVKKENETI